MVSILIILQFQVPLWFVLLGFVGQIVFIWLVPLKKANLTEVKK